MICTAINSVALFLHEGNVHSSPSRHLSTINYLKTFLRLTETEKKKKKTGIFTQGCNFTRLI